MNRLKKALRSRGSRPPSVARSMYCDRARRREQRERLLSAQRRHLERVRFDRRMLPPLLLLPALLQSSAAGATTVVLDTPVLVKP